MTTLATSTRLRFTGNAVETVEAAVLARNIDRNEVIKASDVVLERRPKAEVGNDVAARRPRGRHAGAAAASRRPGAEKPPIWPNRTSCSATRTSP